MGLNARNDQACFDKSITRPARRGPATDADRSRFLSSAELIKALPPVKGFFSIQPSRVATLSIRPSKASGPGALYITMPALSELRLAKELSKNLQEHLCMVEIS